MPNFLLKFNQIQIKKKLLLLFSLFGFFQSYAQTITTSAITGSPFCAGATVNVPYTKTGTFTAGNIFTAQLSNAAGSFASPVNIGTLTSVNAGTIAATIPAGTATGAGYRIRVVGSNPNIIGSNNGTNLTINAKPAVPTISTDYCVGGGFVQLTSSSASSYLWSTGETTQTILVNLAGTYTVTVSNAAGCTNIGSVAVATELVTNGGFEAGNTGFTSAYTYLPNTNLFTGPGTSLWPEGLYTVAADAHNYHSNFWGLSRLNTGK